MVILIAFLQQFVLLHKPWCISPPYILSFHVVDTIRYGRLTCAQKLTRWPA